MFFSTKKIVGRLINLGCTDESDNALNQRRIINFSYLAFSIECLFLCVLFAYTQIIHISLFALGCFFLSVFGWRYNYTHCVYKAQWVMPLLQSMLIVILSLFYFGENSAFHWLFASIIVYSLIVFRPEQRFVKYVFVLTSLLLFLMCQFFSLKGVYLTDNAQSVVATFVFLMVSCYFSIVVHFIMRHLNVVDHRLRTLVEKDELTGVSSRYKSLSNAAAIFSDCMGDKLPCVFVIIDLDHFKKINDTYGHDAGDLVLSQVAALISSEIKDQDQIGRYGGEEFIVIMPNTTLKQAEECMERIRQAIENMLIETEQGIVIPVTVSAGLASTDANVSRYEDVLVQADKGLSIAKRSGRNRIFTQSDFQN